VNPDIRLVVLILLGAGSVLGLGITIGRWMMQRHVTHTLADARQELNRRRAASQRNEREVISLTQARAVDAADLERLQTQVADVGQLRDRVGQVEQQSVTIERLYRQVADLRQQLAERRERDAAVLAVAHALAVEEVVIDEAAPEGTSEPAAADPSDSPDRGDSVDSVDIAAFEAANIIANGIPRARDGKGRGKADHDDLTLIEGIGPRIESLCHAAGITTWQAMADTPIERLRDMLATAGSRYTMHQPENWPAQARELLAGRPTVVGRTDSDMAAVG